ncbi:MAG: tRNA lysidine(34) synthetase TilS [Elusimicrobia bacterium]|nr:tRNA lysidine(34) synthetase TilS [Elusimicrobiota bacterium]MBD3412396.1 tRNA lysidine(34) synthetase TilS [Elusimicrobiota bacterium]
MQKLPSIKYGMVRDKFIETVRNNKLVKQHDSIMAGVSGGPDSVCLALLLRDLQKKIPFTLSLVHFNHKLRRKDSEKDELFVKNLGSTMRVAVHCCNLPVRSFASTEGIGLEEAARILRHRRFERIAKQHTFTKIALGHTLDDQVETVLINMLRGTGLKGLAAMRFNRSLPGSPIPVIRPLLNIEKKEIITFLKKNKQPFRIDKTNLKNDFFRNRIRNKLIPVLSQYNPGIKQHMANLARIMASEEDFKATIISKIKNKILRTLKDRFVLDLIGFNKYHYMIRCGLIQDLVERDLSFIAIRSLIIAAENRKTGYVHLIPGFGCAEISHNSIILRKFDKQKVTKPKKIRLLIPGTNLCSSWGTGVTARILANRPCNLDRGQSVAFIDWSKLKTKQLYLRSRLPGDRFVPFGMNGSKKISDFLQECNVPRSERDRIPIVCTDSEVIWVAGLRIDDRWKVTDKTKQTLELSLEK